MKLNGFNSDDYRYFYLDKSQDWSGFTNFSYGELKENDIIKLSKRDLAERLFSSNYYNRIIENIYPHNVVEYPLDKPFDLFEYIKMQQPITFKWNGVLSFIYEYGEYAYINSWMNQKMNSSKNSKRISAYRDCGTIKEENERILNLIRDEEIVNIKKDLVISTEQLSQKFQNKTFKFKTDTKFELEYSKDETWSLVDSSIFMAVFNQDFIRLLANSTEILGQEKERIFLEEYKDNIPNLTRRYYRVKEGITINEIYEIIGDLSLEHFNSGFDSLIVRINAEMVSTCKLNKDNFNSNGSIKYFYVDYFDSFNDRIAEKEILKIAVRVSQKEALEIHQRNVASIMEKRTLNEALEYIQKHKSSYRKFCHRNIGTTPIDFVENEKQQLLKRLINILKNANNFAK